MLGGAGVAGHACRSHLAQDLGRGRYPHHTGYSAGQVAGPLLVTPLLHDGYRQPLAVAAVIIMLAAGAAGALRYRFPHSR